MLEIDMETPYDNTLAYCRSPLQACGVIYAVVLDDIRKKSVHEKLKSIVRSYSHSQSISAFNDIYLTVMALSLEERRQLVNQATLQLGQLAKADASRFLKILKTLIRIDNTVTLFEWSLYRIAKHAVEPEIVAEKRSLYQCQAQIHSLFQYILVSDSKLTLEHINRQMMALDIGFIHQRDAFSLSELDDAMTKLEALKPLQKPILLKAVAALYLRDGVVNDREYVMLSCLSQILRCPMPNVSLRR